MTGPNQTNPPRSETLTNRVHTNWMLQGCPPPPIAARLPTAALRRTAAVCASRPSCLDVQALNSTSATQIADQSAAPARCRSLHPTAVKRRRCAARTFSRREKERDANAQPVTRRPWSSTAAAHATRVRALSWPRRSERSGCTVQREEDKHSQISQGGSGETEPLTAGRLV